MAMFQNLSIRRRQAWIIILTSGIAVFLASLAFIVYDRVSYKNAMTRDLEILAEIIGASSTAALAFDHPNDATETLSTLRAKSHIVSAAIYGADGSPFATYHREAQVFDPPPPGDDRRPLFTEGHLEVFWPVVLDAERLGTVYLRSDTEEMESRQVRHASVAFVFLVASSLLAFLATTRLQRQALEPILHLARMANEVSVNKDYSVRGIKKGQDEVGALVDAFNAMLTQIQEWDLALQKANDELESRVEARTADLRRANEKLLDEIGRHRQTAEALRQSEEQLLQSQKMDAVGKLAGGVAHDFNNQLAIIRGYVEMALDELPEGTRVHSDLQQISNAVQRSTSLTDQLLAFSSKQPVNRRPLNLNRHVSELRIMLTRVLGEDVVVHLDLEKDLWTVSADSGNMSQIVTNLAVNARDAMPEGGTLTIQTSNVHVDASDLTGVPEARPGRFACLKVTDTGVGMDREVRERLFEPFYTTKGPGRGTGLGLSVVYGIVQSHEGWISVASEPGQGCAIEIGFPAVHVETEGSEQGSQVPLHRFRGQGERLLLVEDEPALRDMTCKALADRGYRVEACGTAAEAKEAFAASSVPYDLVLCDVVLPDGRGPDVVFEMLRAQKDLAAILVTGYTDERGDWERAREARLPLLQKPVPMPRLLEEVQTALRGRQQT